MIKKMLKFGFKIIKKITPKFVKKRLNNYFVKKYTSFVPNDNALHIAILIHGGFGDNLISSAWIKELYRNIDCGVEIDIYAHPSHHCLFHMMPYKTRLFESYLYNNAVRYDLKLNIAHFVEIIHWVPYRIFDKDKKFFNLLEKIDLFNKKYKKYCDNQPYFDGEWANLMIKLGRNRWSELNIDGEFDFDSSKGLVHLNNSKYEVMDKLNLQDKRYITIHAGSDVTWNKNPTKLWLQENYNELCKLIKQKYPELLIVQLGAGNNSLPIANIDINCLGKLNMAESMIVLKHSLLHIDGETGLVHLKRQLQGKSIVLFGPTPIEYFKYDENININSPFSCTDCMWKLKNWNSICSYTGSEYPTPCMTAITPQMVMEELIQYVDIQLKEKTEIIQTDLEIYSTDGLNKYDPILTDIYNVFEIEKLSISKQWEYPYAVDKIIKYKEHNNEKKIKIAYVGGGAGLLAPYLVRLGYDATVFDINFTWDHDGDPKRTEKSRLRWAENNGLKLEYGSIFNIPAEDETYDVVTCISVVEHVPEKFYAFKEMLRVLKPGGVLIVTYDLVDSRIKKFVKNNTRVEMFSPASIQKTLSAFGIIIKNHTSEDIKKSIEDMRRDKVNIYDGITVGGFILKKDILLNEKNI